MHEDILAIFLIKAYTQTPDKATLQVWINAEHFLQLQSQHTVTGIKSKPMSIYIAFSRQIYRNYKGCNFIYIVQLPLS